MPVRHVVMLILLCVIWAANVVVSRIVVTDLAFPPLSYAAWRSVITLLVLIPWLHWPGKDWWRVALVTIAVSGGGFALFFIGLQDATPSSAAIVNLTGAPLTVLFAMAVLKEQVHWRRAAGIVLAFGGVLMAVASPHGWANSTGLLYVFAGAVVGALGSVYLKTIDLAPLKLMAWAGFFSSVLLLPLSLVFETGQVSAIQANPFDLTLALAFSSIVVSVFAHTIYFGILQANEAGLVAPITLLTPVFTIMMGAAITGDDVGPAMIAGGLLACSGVLVITVRPSRAMFKGLLVRVRI